MGGDSRASPVGHDQTGRSKRWATGINAELQPVFDPAPGQGAVKDGNEINLQHEGSTYSNSNFGKCCCLCRVVLTTATFLKGSPVDSNLYKAEKQKMDSRVLIIDGSTSEVDYISESAGLASWAKK